MLGLIAWMVWRRPASLLHRGFGNRVSLRKCSRLTGNQLPKATLLLDEKSSSGEWGNQEPPRKEGRLEMSLSR